MTLCALCAQPTIGDEAMCVYHPHGHGAEWATGNRIMCDFLHRGIVPGTPERPETLDLLIETLEDALVP